MADDDELVRAIPPRQIAAFREVVAENLSASLARSEAFERRATTLLTVVTASLTFLLAAAGFGVESGAGWWALIQCSSVRETTRLLVQKSALTPAA